MIQCNVLNAVNETFERICEHKLKGVLSPQKGRRVLQQILTLIGVKIFRLLFPFFALPCQQRLKKPGSVSNYFILNIYLENTFMKGLLQDQNNGGQFSLDNVCQPGWPVEVSTELRLRKNIIWRYLALFGAAWSVDRPTGDCAVSILSNQSRSVRY